MKTTKEHSFGERLLTIENVCVSYDRPILEKVNATIDNIVRPGMQQGQVVALLGPSGVGKTQLFRCIAGLQQPTSGSVRLRGEKDQVLPGDVGVVAQHYPLFNHRTILGNLLVAAGRTGARADEAKARCYELLEEFGLETTANQYPAQLSGGQRQRIAIAQQLLCSSHFLLMDEPFSGLDPLAKTRVCQTIAQVATTHELNTTIVITHDVESAIRIADTLWLMGRSKNAAGEYKHGATIQRTYDLISMGLAWEPEIDRRPEFFEFTNEIKNQFNIL